MTPTTEIASPNERPPAERVNVILSREVIDVLDGTAAYLGRNTGARFNRSEIIRAVIGAFGASRLTFRGCRTEAEMRSIMDRCFGMIAKHVAQEDARRGSPVRNEARRTL